MEKSKGTPRRKKQKKLKGIPAAPGIVMGRAYVFGTETVSPPEIPVNAHEMAGEIEKFEDAITKTRKELLAIEKKISKEMGVEHGRIFNAHLMVLEDKVLHGQVISRMKKRKRNISFVFAEVLNSYIAALSSAKDEYLRDRSGDIADVGKRILKNLVGAQERSMENLGEKSIIIAYDLSPSDTAMMHKGRVLGFATDIGGRTSHTAIMAKSLEIPAVVGLENVTDMVSNGDFVILDGIHGMVLVNPSRQLIDKYQEEKEKYESIERDLGELRLLAGETLDGKKVGVAGNIELPEDVASVLSHGAQGIGLYRTEYFYMNRADLPSEEEQFNAYKSVVKRMYPNPVVIRTLDLGGDKFLSQLDVPREMNPFMGWRAIRFCLARPDIFRSQLRAMLRASVHGKIKIMYPMISGLSELREANKFLGEVKKELRKEKVPFDENIPVGAMIEVPAAAVMSDILAKEADFFSIGTNDLIQYSLAVDRVNEKIAYLYEPAHPGVLKLIKMVIDSGHREGIPVSLCGEMAGDISLTMVLLGLGLDEFSTSPIAVPEIKKVVRSIKFSDARKVAEKVLAFNTGEEVRNFAREKLYEFIPDLALELL